jgi:hypothetical protein
MNQEPVNLFKSTVLFSFFFLQPKKIDGPGFKLLGSNADERLRRGSTTLVTAVLRPPDYSQAGSLSRIQGKSEVTTRRIKSGRTFSDPVCSLISDSCLARRPVVF